MTAGVVATPGVQGLARRLALPSSAVHRILAALASFPLITRTTVYGSRAKGTARRGSDIDLVIDGAHLNTRQLNRIATSLDDLLLPYEIDLSIRDHIDNAALLDHIDRVGIVIFDRSHGRAPRKDFEDMVSSVPNVPPAPRGTI